MLAPIWINCYIITKNLESLNRHTNTACIIAPLSTKSGEQRSCGGSSICESGAVIPMRVKNREFVHSIFAMSLARSFHSDPHGMIFIHASCDQPLMNSPITKICNVIGSFIS